MDGGWERRKQATRRGLRMAALDLASADGLDQVSVDAISERAGVSRRTFFNYFASKEDAVLLDLFAVSEADLAAFAAGPPSGVWADLTTLFVADVERMAEEAVALPRFLALHARHPLVQARQFAVFGRFEGRLRAAITDRLGDASGGSLRAGVMSGSCITAVRVGLAGWAEAGRSGPVRPQVEAAFAVLDPAFPD